MATTWDGAAQEHPVIAESSPGRHVAGVRVWEGVPLISGPRAKRCCVAGQREHGGTVHAAGWRRVDSCARGEPPASLPLGVWDSPLAPRVHVSCAEGHQPADYYILDDQPAQGWVSGWVPPHAVRRPRLASGTFSRSLSVTHSLSQISIPTCPSGCTSTQSRLLVPLASPGGGQP